MPTTRALVFLACLAACETAAKTERDAKVPVAAASVDSSSPIVPDTCPPAKAKTAADIVRDSTDGKAGGSWNDLHVRSTSSYSIDLPSVAGVTEGGIEPFPDCQYCSLSIRVWHSSKGAKEHVDSLLRAEAVRDSMNKLPGIEGQEFNDYFGPAVTVKDLRDSAVFLTGGCGDCMSGSFFFGRPGQLAEVSYQADYSRDRERRRCEMTRVALTFHWKDPLKP